MITNHKRAQSVEKRGIIDGPVSTKELPKHGERKSWGPLSTNNWIRNVLDWDEAQDPAAAPRKTLPWHLKGTRDRQLLDALADGVWTNERALRGFLRWGRLQFFLTTTRMVVMGWIESRPVSSEHHSSWLDLTIFESEYRLSVEAWE